MKAVTKFITGAATAAMITVGAAAPAEAQRYGGYGYRDRDRGIDAGDIITGVAVLGGIAAIASALDRDGSRYGYGYRSRYRDGYSTAVNSCAYEAERIGRGRVRITDVDRTGANRFRVRGVIEDNRGYGYDRYDRYDRYSRYDRNGRYGREDFTCHARSNGRITDFNL